MPFHAWNEIKASSESHIMEGAPHLWCEVLLAECEEDGGGSGVEPAQGGGRDRVRDHVRRVHFLFSVIPTA
jgi:hypothetical protein